ncbi:MAG: DUF4249 family protein [Marinoscillum sp.]|uniref:DUF4249 family protein n=3 Tax=Marinoscillum sp. TaxID=2024838 RepID=UPI0032FE2D1F
MSRHILQVFSIISLMLSAGCVSPYDFDSEYTEYLIVDGKVTNIGSEIILSYSGKFDPKNTTLRPLNGAEVLLEDNNGGSYHFEGNANVYTPPQGFSPKVDATYTLKVLAAGQSVISEPETIHPGFSFQLETEKATREVFISSKFTKNINGHQVIAQIDSAIPDNTYVKWDYLVLWTHPYTGQLMRESGASQFEVMSTADLKKSGSSSFLVLFWEDIQRYYFAEGVAGLEPSANFQYHIFVTQTTLSKRAYQYWQQVHTQLKNTGGIFDAIPGTIDGNLSIPGTDLPVLGYFTAGASIRKEIVLDDVMILVP